MYPVGFGKKEGMKRKANMPLKTRIVLSFLISILLPLILGGIIFWSLLEQRSRRLGEEYGITNPRPEMIANNALLLNELTQENYQALKKSAGSAPEEFESEEWLSAVNASLREKKSFLVLLRNDKIIFNGSEDISDCELEKQLPHSHGEAEDNNEVWFNGEWFFHLLSFSYADGSEGRAVIITIANQIAPQMSGFIREVLLSMIVIMFVTGVCLYLWIYYGVATPLRELRKGTQNIKNGNLNFTIHPSGVREISELCEDFEEMRIRLKENAEEQIENDRASKELISNISHDLKTPITSVKGYVEGIMDGVANTPEKLDRYIRTIYNKANEMDRLINELTFYSKIDTNRIPYTFTKIHISDYFDDCVEEIGLDLEAHGVKLSYVNSLQEDFVVIADVEQLQRVINNIISNSMKYMDKEEKKISIRLKDVGDFVQVEMEDNGKGIAARDLGKIFDRFYRTDASRNSPRGGSGIGLSIVRKILEDHGGKVWATSKEGMGTTMYFVLRKYQEVPAHE